MDTGIAQQSTLTRLGKTSGNFAGNQKEAAFIEFPSKKRMTLTTGRYSRLLDV
jgi:hypothetical protein